MKFKSLRSFLLVPVAGFAIMCQTSPPPPIASGKAALTSDQCTYFAVNGKTRICHHTSSTKNPYTIVNVSDNACINAHAAHVGDYVAVNDPTCKGGGCLPLSAPCDPTLPCCEGSTCQAGVCVSAGPTCSGIGSAGCKNGTSPPTCQCDPGFAGTNCEFDIDECESNPCLRGQCVDCVNGYICECDPGFTGPLCDVPN